MKCITGEMDNYLDRYHKPKLNQDQVNYLKGNVTLKEIKAGIINLLSEKRRGLGGFSAEFYETFKEELRPTHLGVFHGIETEAPSTQHSSTQYSAPKYSGPSTQCPGPSTQVPRTQVHNT